MMAASSSPSYQPRTLYDKLFNQHAVTENENGTVILYIDRHLVHEVTSPQAFDGLRKRGRRLRRPDFTLATSDHNVPTTSRIKFTNTRDFIDNRESRAQCVTLERNVEEYGIRYFGLDSTRQGIVHVIGPEMGFTLPGLTIVCGDSHTSTHGAFGSLAFGIGTTEVEHVFVTQTLVTTRSRNMKIQVDGDLGPCVTSKDLIMFIIGVVGTAGGTGMVIEFAGTTIEGLSMESRMTLCNMSIEAGAKSGLIAPDQTTFDYLKHRPMAPKCSSPMWDRAVAYWSTLRSDEGAIFDQVIHVDTSAIIPSVTWGTSPEQVVPITGTVPYPGEFTGPARQEGCRRALQYMGLEPGMRMQDIGIDKVFIGSCTNSRIEDLRVAARIVYGRHVAATVKVALVVPGSGLIKKLAEKEGLDVIFQDAGFEWREAGCSLCVGMNEDMLLPFERCASTSNRNFESRQGTFGRTHLMSPASAAASAIDGKLADARGFSPVDEKKVSPRTKSIEIHMDVDLSDEGRRNGDMDAHPSTTVGCAGTIVDRPGTITADNVSQVTKFEHHQGIAAPLHMSNIDTDCIIPKQFCKTVARDGLADGLFYHLRNHVNDTEDGRFVLNKQPYRRASILVVTGANFGCGSSREHAVWALMDFGFRCIIAPSFADIFANNAFKNGLLLVALPDAIPMAAVAAEAANGHCMKVDLVQQMIWADSGLQLATFVVEKHRRKAMLMGLDEVATTLLAEEEIRRFEEQRHAVCPWVADGVQLSPLTTKTCIPSTGMSGGKGSRVHIMDTMLQASSLRW